MRVALAAVLALAACGGRSRECPGGGDPHAACLDADDVEARYHALAPRIAQLESALAGDLAAQPLRCGRDERSIDAPVFADVQKSLRVLVGDHEFAGATLSIVCDMRSLIVATAGASPGAFAGVGTRLDDRELSWGTFDALPPPSRGLAVESELALPDHQRARVTWLFTIQK